MGHELADVETSSNGRYHIEAAVSGSFSTDVLDEAFELISIIQDSTDVGIDKVKTELDIFSYFPVILANNLGMKQKAARSYSRNDQSEAVNVEIPYFQWLH